MFSVVSGENQEWWELFKKASVGTSSLSGKISAETALIQSWFSCSGFLVFQRCVRENQRCSALFQRKSALKQLWFSADFFALKLWFFSAVSEKISCFRENQRWNSSDSALIFLLWKFSVSELFQRKSALFSSESALFQSWTAVFQRWFLALKISVFRAVQSWNSAVQRFSGNEQRWNRPESILNQSWSALNVSETSTRAVSLEKIGNLFREKSFHAHSSTVLNEIWFSKTARNYNKDWAQKIAAFYQITKKLKLYDNLGFLL